MIPICKPFRHSYQAEHRIVCVPPKPLERMDPCEVAIGPLSDCAVLVDQVSHPPPTFPHDPAEDPIRAFGTINSDSDMIHKLPAASKVQGIVLHKPTSRHEDWFFELQYTDQQQAWHQVRMSMPDGLYLLNLLQSADREQGLGFLNQVSQLRSKEQGF